MLLEDEGVEFKANGCVDMKQYQWEEQCFMNYRKQKYDADPGAYRSSEAKAGENGLEQSVRWGYFADCLQCIKSEYRIE